MKPGNPTRIAKTVLSSTLLDEKARRNQSILPKKVPETTLRPKICPISSTS